MTIDRLNGTPNGVHEPSRTGDENALSVIIGDRKPWRLRLALLLAVKKDKRSRRKMRELLENAKAVGEITVPLIVYFDSKAQQYRVADGETRRQVGIILGFDDVPVYVIDEPKDENELARIQVVANSAQKPMLPIDLANAVRDARDRNPGWKQKEIGALFGMVQGTVSKYLEIAEVSDLLPESAHELPWTILAEIAALRGNPEALSRFLAMHEAHPMSRSVVAREVAKLLGKRVEAKQFQYKSADGFVVTMKADYATAITQVKTLFDLLRKGQQEGTEIEKLL